MLKLDTIIEQIRQLGKQYNITPYLVGGYLRDKFLRRANHDIDIMVENDALEFARLFAKVYGYPSPVFYGKFGTAMIEIEKNKIEFATARKESYDQFSRKPHVKPATVLEDLARRDFTINAMAQNLLTGELLDPFGGKTDIRKKIVRTPVDPDITFYDDPLRILRGIRFATVLNFAIEENTKKAMAKNVNRLSIVSQERIADEIMKMIAAKKPSTAFILLDEIGALDLLMPEIASLKEKKTDHPCKELFEHTLQVLDNTARLTKNPVIRIAALLHDIGKPKTLKIENGKVSFHRHEIVGAKKSLAVCERLKISQKDAETVSLLIKYHLRPHLLAKENPTDNALARFIREIGTHMKSLFIIAQADITSKNEKKVKEGREKIIALYERIKELNRKMKLSKFKLAIDGFVIMEICGLKPGKQVGLVKKKLEEMVLNGEIENKKTKLRDYLKKHCNELLSEVENGKKDNGYSVGTVANEFCQEEKTKRMFPLSGK
ncbi:MAG: CCA tRNA nucleotidyltransferase [Candidatus Omnitrophica bacterium]|nr:CCA tRNA nucleotidyltransferase [Candidatus Omnitrophota bacterium]